MAEDAPKPEHGHYILYAFGAVCLSMGAWFAARALQEGPWAGEGRWPLGLGAVAVLIGALLHDRERRRWPEVPAVDEAPDDGQGLRIGVGLLLLPLLGAWVQFELFMVPIQMFPFTTVIGGVVTSYALVRRLLPEGRVRGVLAPSLAAGLGVPGALLAHALLVGHFTHHLSNVEVWVLPGSEFAGGEPTMVGADVPMAESELDLPTAQLALMASLDAQPMDASEYRVEPDGTVMHLEPDGTETPMPTLTADDLGAMFEQARQEDEDAAREARARRRAAYAAEIEALRLGGRLFR